MTFREARQSWIPHPLLPLRSLSARYDSRASSRLMPFWLPREVTPVTTADEVRASIRPVPYAWNASRCTGSSRSRLSPDLGPDRSAARERRADDPVPPSAFQPDPDAIAAHGAPHHRDAVHIAAGDADPDEAAGNGIAALQHHPGEIEAGSRRGDDDDAALARIGDAVASGADPHLALHLGAGAGGPEAGRVGGSRGEKKEE